MRDGRLFRYGEDRAGLPEAALLEQEFAAYLGIRYVVGVNSGGCAIFLALKAAGVGPGDKVLVNAFTLAPVPGAVAHAGAESILVDITENYVVDLDDLERKAATSGARYFLLSYTRGHVPDMDRVGEVCQRHELTLIEDCAHTMGAGWDGRMTGTFGAAGCFSTQTFKHINSGEGGLLATDDDDLAARAIIMSGAYWLYGQNAARPPIEVFEKYKYTTPNFSMRMSNLVAAVLRPQLALMDERTASWRTNYRRLADLLRAIDHIAVPERPAKEDAVPSSIQFSVTGLRADQIEDFIAICERQGIHVKWFGGREPVGFTSSYEHWRYIEATPELRSSRRVLDGLCDMRIPLSLSEDDCRTIAAILREAIAEAAAAG
ncbi:MAG: aminotransferase class I/II-fold pyridoxal phosphate-dependent enzyme [Alphaproteobacteria bacterium]|nr:aminotransferase class I/II-fold pyridoxal phosphate-dependent enzyme [Alphaproteobacteria bacterium]